MPRDRRAGAGAASSRARNLALRIASGMVLAPLVLAAAYAGGWVFLLLCLAGAAGILWEWVRIVRPGASVTMLAAGWLALIAAAAFVGRGDAAAAAAMVAAGAVAVALIAARGSANALALDRAGWPAAGAIYAGIALLGPALLRRDAQYGFIGFLFLAATVWATDIFAYGVGRAIGGPLLWPRVSPNKTWAGAVGGLAGGVAGGTLVAYANGIGRLTLVGVIALLLSGLAQAGDLLESAVKRRFGVKDASHIIPGHGGLMDRLDGFLIAAGAAALIGIARYGTDASAHGLLLW